jgi:uncharacterized membrane protein YjjP (DUF1212 family)
MNTSRWFEEEASELGVLRTLAKIGGVLFIVVGVIFAAAGLYGIVAGGGTWTINGEEVSPDEGGRLLLVVGVVVVLVGFALIYAARKLFHGNPLAGIAMEEQTETHE